MCDQLNKAMVVAGFTLLNTLSSKRFVGALEKSWPSDFDASKVSAVSQKLTTSFFSARIDALRYVNEITDLYDYLDNVARLSAITISRTEKKHKFAKISLVDYDNLLMLCYCTSDLTMKDPKISQPRFAFNNLLHATLNLLVGKDTVSGACSNAKFNTLLSKIFKEKPVSYFHEGFLADFLVIDRMLSEKSKGYVIVKDSHLSTKFFLGCKPKYLKLDGHTVTDL